MAKQDPYIDKIEKHILSALLKCAVDEFNERDYDNWKVVHLTIRNPNDPKVNRYPPHLKAVLIHKSKLDLFRHFRNALLTECDFEKAYVLETSSIYLGEIFDKSLIDNYDQCQTQLVLPLIRLADGPPCCIPDSLFTQVNNHIPNDDELTHGFLEHSIKYEREIIGCHVRIEFDIESAVSGDSLNIQLGHGKAIYWNHHNIKMTLQSMVDQISSVQPMPLPKGQTFKIKTKR